MSDESWWGIVKVFEYSNRLEEALDRALELVGSEQLIFIHAVEFSNLKEFMLEIRRYSSHTMIIDRTIERTTGKGKVIVAEDEGKIDLLYAINSAIEDALRQRFKKTFMIKWDENFGFGSGADF